MAPKSPAAERVTASDVRRRLDDLLDRIASRHDEFVIERKGRPLAALVAVERLDAMREAARLHALDFLIRQRGGGLTEESAMALANGAKRWARSRGRKRRP